MKLELKMNFRICKETTEFSLVIIYTEPTPKRLHIKGPLVKGKKFFSYRETLFLKRIDWFWRILEKNSNIFLQNVFGPRAQLVLIVGKWEVSMNQV